MSMLEQMARRLATDALERVKPGTYTNVVDEIWLYRSEDGGKLTVSDYPHLGEVVPTLDSTTAVDTMVAMMAEQAGAIVVVPEDAPMDSHLVQIAQLLVNSADVPTDAQDVADGVAIVGTVKRALDMLATARNQVHRLNSSNEVLSDAIESIGAMLVKSPDIALGKDDLQTVDSVECGVGKALRYLGEVRREAIELRKQVDTWKGDAKRDAARFEQESVSWQTSRGHFVSTIELLNERVQALEMDKKNADTTIDAIARQRDALYERKCGVLDAFRVVVAEMIEVGK